MSEFTKEVLDRVVFAADRHVPQFLLVSKQARAIYQKMMINIADREWRKRNWGKPRTSYK
jgi:hypothetical protein